jgi:signal transduction histidine kinase
MTSPTVMPRPARLLITLVTVAGVVAVAFRLTRLGELSAHDWLSLALVAAAIVVADRCIVEIPHGDETESFTLSDGVWTAALVLSATGVPTLAAVIGTAAWQLAARWPLRKVLFNVGQVAISLTLAESVMSLLPSNPDPLRPVTWVVAAAAMLAAWSVNMTSVALVIALVHGESFRRVLLAPWRVNLTHWVGNVSGGLLAAVLWHVSPFGLVLLGVPCSLLFLAYRDWVRSTIEANQMEAMMKGAETIARERAFGARLPVGERTGRLPELAVALNHMLDQLELAFQRQRQLMADVAGQLRRPIGEISRVVAPVPPTANGTRNGAAVNGSGGIPVPHELAGTLDRVGRVLDDMAEIGGSQLPGFVEPRPVDVAELVQDIGRRAEPFLGDRLQTLAPATSATVELDRDRIEQALLRLLQNTADHASGPVGFRTTQEERAILFEVVDEGGGVPAGHEDAIFEPFYRAGSRHQGGGLGLALVRTVAEAHGGSAGVVNRPGAGVTFWLRVPR